MELTVLKWPNFKGDIFKNQTNIYIFIRLIELKKIVFLDTLMFIW